MDFTIVYCVTLTSYGKALYLHFYYLTIWTHCTCMYVYILSEIKFYYYNVLTLSMFSKKKRGDFCRGGQLGPYAPPTGHNANGCFATFENLVWSQFHVRIGA